MELKTAIEILEYHQEWRLGKREDMIHEPKKLTQALDIVLNTVKKISRGIVIESVTGHSCPNCGTISSDESIITRFKSTFEVDSTPQYSEDEIHICHKCGIMYLLRNVM